MKPKNKFQRQIFELSQKLPPITEVQENWAFQNCITHYAKRTVKGIITCFDCGNAWKGNSEPGDALLGVECPQCSTKLEILNSPKRTSKQSAFFCMITTKGKYQVLRFFLLKYYAKAGRKANFYISEVVQRWIAPSGKYETVARTRPMSYYEDNWNLGSNLEIRPERDHHQVFSPHIYPRQRITPELKRGGYRGDCYRVNPFDLFLTLLSDSRAETLLKAGQINVLEYFAGKNFHRIDSYWASLKICIRNNYQISDVSIWRDYLELLSCFGKDLHNAHYVCPADLKAEHDRYVSKKQKLRERQNREKAKKKAFEDDRHFREMKARFFGIHFSDGLIHVRMLESTDDVRQEGDIMHHCVFTNDYHLKSDSIILSAFIGDNRLETVEFSLSQLKVVQSRGVCNQNTEYHDRIIKLVEKNKRLIKRRLAA